MSLVAALLLASIQTASLTPQAIGKTLDATLTGLHWKGSWNSTGNKVKGVFTKGERLKIVFDVKSHDLPGFWESRPPREVIPLYGKETMFKKGRDWWVRLLDFSDGQRQATKGKPSQTNLMLIFYNGPIGGSVKATTTAEQGFHTADYKLATQSLKKVGERLVLKFGS